MPRTALRITKSRSLLLSLYTLSGVAILYYFSLLCLSLYKVSVDLSFDKAEEIFQLFLSSFSLILVAMLMSLPVALALTFSIVSNYRSRTSMWIENFLAFVDQSPMLLYGLFFIIVFGHGAKSLYLASAFIAVTKLAYRWIKLSNKISFLQIETALSMGMSLWQVLKTVYFRKFIKMYLVHYFSVACLLFGVVTPFLCIISYNRGDLEFFSVHFFKGLGLPSSQTSPIQNALLRSLRYDCLLGS